MNESSDTDRGFNPFRKKSEKQNNISIDTISSLDEVIIFHFYKTNLLFKYI